MILSHLILCLYRIHSDFVSLRSPYRIIRSLDTKLIPNPLRLEHQIIYIYINLAPTTGAMAESNLFSHLWTIAEVAFSFPFAVPLCGWIMGALSSIIIHLQEDSSSWIFFPSHSMIIQSPKRLHQTRRNQSNPMNLLLCVSNFLVEFYLTAWFHSYSITKCQKSTDLPETFANDST